MPAWKRHARSGRMPFWSAAALKRKVSAPRHYAQEGAVDLRDGESRLPNFRGFTIKHIKFIG